MGYFGRNSKQHAADLERDRNMHARAQQQALDDKQRVDKDSSLEAGAHDGHLNEDTGSEMKNVNEHEAAAAENRRGVDHTIDPDAGLSDAERHARVS